MQDRISWTRVCYVCRYVVDESKNACFILFALLLQGGCSWPNNLTAFGLVQPNPAPLLEWWPNQQAQALVLVKQCHG